MAKEVNRNQQLGKFLGVAAIAFGFYQLSNLKIFTSEDVTPDLTPKQLETMWEHNKLHYDIEAIMNGNSRSRDPISARVYIGDQEKKLLEILNKQVSTLPGKLKHEQSEL